VKNDLAPVREGGVKSIHRGLERGSAEKRTGRTADFTEIGLERGFDSSASTIIEGGKKREGEKNFILAEAHPSRERFPRRGGRGERENFIYWGDFCGPPRTREKKKQTRLTGSSAAAELEKNSEAGKGERRKEADCFEITGLYYFRQERPRGRAGRQTRVGRGGEQSTTGGV